MAEKIETLVKPTLTMTPIIKVTGDYCNLKCSYCFYNQNDQSTPHIMHGDILEKFIRQYLELFSNHVVFIWHGGEPTLAGLPFFEKVIELQNKYGKHNQIIRNHIQTNGTLITDKWANFFKRYDFKIGVSIDGDRISHNLFRRDKRRKGTFDRVMRGVKILQRNKIRYGIIQVMTSANIPNIEKCFNFFTKHLHLEHWSINTYLNIDNNVKMRDQSITNDQLIEISKTYIDLWIREDNENLTIREIESFVFGVQRKISGYCTFNGTCIKYFCLNYDGKIYPCDNFTNNLEMVLGDLSNQSLSEILNGYPRLEYVKRVNQVHPDCAPCDWRLVCNNGCPSHRIGGVDGKYYYCQARKEIFSYTQKLLEKYC